MKPKQAIAVTSGSAVKDAIEFGFNARDAYHKSVRSLVEALEADGFKVHIIKDGQEFNR